MIKPAPAFELPMNVEQIAAMLPHRYPFLLLDRIIACEPGKQLTAIKNVTVNEPFFQGHFPGHPVMPGVLIVESMAQAGGVLTMLSRSLDTDKPLIFYLVKVDKARFNRPVVPGDQLRLEVGIKRSLRNMSLFQCQALVDGTVVAEAEILCAGVVHE